MMKIGLVSSAVPLINGGYRFIVEWLCEQLVARGHEVEVLYIPSTDDLDQILPQMVAFRTIKLDEYFDRVITFRPPAHLVQHPKKIVWFIHHFRRFYDLWDTPYRDFSDDVSLRALRTAIVAADTRALESAHRLYTNSRVVGERVKRFNGLDSEVLYPPILHSESFRSGLYGDEIVSVCRMEHHKRPHLLIEALGLTKTQVRLRLCGSTDNPHYVEQLRQAAERLGVQERIVIENRWISEDEKVARLETALACAYVPFEEDSYGYPTLEAAHAERCTVTVSDSGGVPEFVIDDINGFVAEPTAAGLAAVFDRLYGDRTLARRLGGAARARIGELGVEWDTVIAKLLA